VSVSCKADDLEMKSSRCIRCVKPLTLAPISRNIVPNVDLAWSVTAASAAPSTVDQSFKLRVNEFVNALAADPAPNMDLERFVSCVGSGNSISVLEITCE